MRVFEKFYLWLIKGSSNLQSLFLLWMRLTWGPQFIVLSLQRLNNLGQSIEFFSSLGFHHPLFHTYLVGYIELIGGILLTVGLASRLAAIPLVFTTLAILSRAHVPALTEWKFITHPLLAANEAPYPFLIAALLVLIFGPGRVSLDGWIQRIIHKKRHE